MPNQVSLFVSHHNPGHVSPQMNRRSSLVPLQYTQVSTWVSQLNSCPISPPTGSQDFHLTSRQTLNQDLSIQTMSQLNTGPYICVSPPFRWCLISIQIHKIASQLHPSTISNPCKFQHVCLTSTQVPKIASQPHPGIIHIYKHPGFKMFISPPFRLHLSPIQVIRFSSQLHQDDVSAPSRSCRLNFSPIRGPILMQFKSQDLCRTFIQILHHLHSSPKILVSPPSRHHLNYKHSHLTFTLATSIQVPIFTPHHNPGHVSPQSRSC